VVSIADIAEDASALVDERTWEIQK